MQCDKSVREMRKITCTIVALLVGITIIFVLTILLLTSHHQSRADDEHCLVKVEHGFLQGKRRSSLYNNSYCAFQGIPFAKPPIGERRFKEALSQLFVHAMSESGSFINKVDNLAFGEEFEVGDVNYEDADIEEAAVPMDKWDSIYIATEQKPMCPQIDLGQRKYEGEEDCLYLNVYVKEPMEHKERIATLVFIHGGAFMSGTARTSSYGPDLLLEGDIIVITIQYRLGVLGFLSIPELGIPGNNGLKDQSLALRWVHDNIWHFGGDPNNVTIMGESAGSASVHYHTMSNMSKGLFQRAIMQSGTATDYWAYRTPEQMNSTFMLLAESIDCNDTETLEEIHKCLMEESPETLAGLALLGTLPTKEESWTGEDTFITYSPHEYVYSGNFHNVSILLGSNAYESSLFVTLMLPLEEDVFDELWVGFGDKYFKQNQIDEPSQERLKNCTWETYFNNNTSFEDGMLDVLTDLLFLIEIDVTANKFASFNSKPVFYYYFQYDGDLCLSRLFNWTSVKVPTHAEELPYIFRNAATPPVIDSEAWKISRKIVKLWTSFVKNGRPSLEMDRDGEDLVWKPFTIHDQQYLEINTNFTMKKDLHHERLEIWQRCK